MNIIEFIFNIPDRSCPITGNRLRNFDIRVGTDSADIGNNALCYHQTFSMGNAETTNFSCHHELFGNWISVNKSDTNVDFQYLHFLEIRVFGSKLKRNVPCTPHMKTPVHVCICKICISISSHSWLCLYASVRVCMCLCKSYKNCVFFTLESGIYLVYLVYLIV